MFKRSFFSNFLIILAFILLVSSEVKAEINFDFGLPLFRQTEVNFEKNKTSDYNLQLLKKYILEHKGNVIAQYQAILRWFTLIKLSDTPRHSELIEAGNKYFSLDGVEKPTSEDKLRKIFYKGTLLSSDKSEDQDSKKDQEFEELLLEYDEELKDKPDYWIAKGILFQALKNRPNNYFSLMKPEEDLKVALTLIPRTSQYYYVMGQCFRFLGNSDSALFLAIASYEKASSLDPRNSKLQNSLISIYMGLHEEYQSKGKHEPFWLEEAVYKKIVEIAPNNPYALNNLGYLYAEYGVNIKTALELCQKAVNQNPNSAGFQDSLGWAAFKNKNYKLAEEALLKSIALKNTVYESHYHLATLYYTTSEYHKAAEQYEVAIKLRPDSAEALNNLAYLYTELNANNDKALSMAKRANQIEPNNASYLDTLGWAYYRNNDLDNALPYLQKANNLVPGQSEILLHIGRVYLEKNDFDKALAYVKEAYKANPTINDPDDTLYLTVRLKAFHEAIANYHGILGENADKDKVISILRSMSNLYQEEGLYDKSIEITKICSSLNNGELNLSEPLLNSYKLIKKEKPEEKKDEKTISNEETKKEGINESDKGNQSNSNLPQTNETEKQSKSEDERFRLPGKVDYPLAISFCSEFFKFVKDFMPNIKELAKCNVTIIMDRFFFPGATAIIRITSNSINGKDLTEGIQAAYGCFASSKKVLDKEENRIYIFPLGNYYFLTMKNAVYISKQKITKEIIDKLSPILPYREGYFMEFYYDNEAFHKRFPDFASGFISNPFKPFERLQASYKMTKNGFCEVITATTNKHESEEFMKRIAGRLFRFKVKSKKKGLETTIRLESQKEIILITTEFDNLFAWCKQKANIICNNLSKLFPLFIKPVPLFN